MAFVAISLNAVHKILCIKRHWRDHFFFEKKENNCDEWDTSDNPQYGPILAEQT